MTDTVFDALHDSKIKTLVCLVSCALIAVVALPALSQDQDQSATTSSGKPIKGHVEHDEKLPSLPGEFQVGTHVDPVQLTALTPDNIWFPLPKWFAGKWHGQSMTVTSVQDCKSGRSEKVNVVRKEIVDVVHGHQRDKTGQVWEYMRIPRVQKLIVDKGTAYLRVVREDVVRSDESMLVLKLLENQLTMDKDQNIVESEQVQQISSYQPMEDGVVQLEASLKNFDAGGNPQQIQGCEKVVQRIAPYEDLDKDGELDLKQLFAEFMKKTGRQDLLPAGM